MWSWGNSQEKCVNVSMNSNSTIVEGFVGFFLACWITLILQSRLDCWQMSCEYELWGDNVACTRNGFLRCLKTTKWTVTLLPPSHDEPREWEETVAFLLCTSLILWLILLWEIFHIATVDAPLKFLPKLHSEHFSLLLLLLFFFFC